MFSTKLNRLFVSCARKYVPQVADSFQGVDIREGKHGPGWFAAGSFNTPGYRSLAKQKTIKKANEGPRVFFSTKDLKELLYFWHRVVFNLLRRIALRACFPSCSNSG